MLMDVIYCAAPCIDIATRPVVGTKKRMVQLLQPAGEDRVRGGGSSRKGGMCISSSEYAGAALLLDPLADLGPIEIVEIAEAAASSRVNSFNALQC